MLQKLAAFFSFRKDFVKMLPVFFYFVLVVLTSLISETQGHCRILKFTNTPVHGYQLKNHTIRTSDVINKDICEMQCYQEPNCVSYNFKKKEEDNGRHKCDLNNATCDHDNEHSGDLLKSEDYVYRGAENACANKPCKNSATCQAGFTDKDYQCLCIPGFTGHDCENGCQDALGMESRAISDEQITASSEYDAVHSPKQGRLHFQEIVLQASITSGGWAADPNDNNPWLQIDLIDPYARVTGVATQGRNGDDAQWVTEYKLQYGDDGNNFQYYREHGNTKDKEFVGNTDQETVVYHKLNPLIITRYIRFVPLAWFGHLSMRVELYGCTKVGWTSGQPGDSCKHIRDSEASKGDGEYWIDPEKNGTPLKVFCDMTTDAGGWLLVSSVVIDSPSSPQLSVESSYSGISNYYNNKMCLTKTAMNELRTHLGFTQLRFHCSKQQGRTFHVTTATNSTGEAVVQYFSGQTDAMPDACGSFVQMENDNSLLAGLCDEWGRENNMYNVGKWGHQAFPGEDRLYNHAAFIDYLYHWYLSGSSRWECDDFKGGISSGDFWKVFVR